MAIEFACSGCGKVLRTADNTAGRQAKCPACGAATVIPSASPPPPPAAPAAPAGPPSVNPFQSPMANDMASQSAYVTGELVAHPIAFEAVLGRAWGLFKQVWGPAVVAMILIMVITYAFMALAALGGAAMDRVLGTRGMANLVMNIASMVFNAWFFPGQLLFFLRLVRTGRAEYALLFSGAPYLLRTWLGSLIFGLAVTVGLILLVVPGVILATIYGAFSVLIVDRNLGLVESFQTSARITTGSRMTIFLLFVTLTLVGLIVIALTCGLGVLLVGPFAWMVWIVAYQDMIGERSAAMPA